MPDPQQDFIEKMGLQSERDGFPRTAGRLFGLLILEEGPFSLDELVERLSVSKASISTNARLLEQSGIAERTTRPGDRRDFYRLAPDAIRRVFSTARTRMREVRELLARTREALPEDANDTRSRIAEMHDFYDFMGTEFDALIERWNERSRAGSSGQAER